jgi:hypothetical protein
MMKIDLYLPVELIFATLLPKKFMKKPNSQMKNVQMTLRVNDGYCIQYMMKYPTVDSTVLIINEINDVFHRNFSSLCDC